MKICQNCGTNQVQRSKVSTWRVECKCRLCKYIMYDTVSSFEYELNKAVKILFPELIFNAVEKILCASCGEEYSDDSLCEECETRIDKEGLKWGD